MIPLFKHLVDALLHDELAAKRWLRAALFTLAGSGFAFADQLGALVAAPGAVRWFKVAAVVAGGVGAAITAGEKNP